MEVQFFLLRNWPWIILALAVIIILLKFIPRYKIAPPDTALIISGLIRRNYKVRNADGTTKEVSYYPRRFTFSYDFKIKLRVNTPYFDEMNFDLNGSDVEISGVRTESPNQVLRMANPEYKHYYQMGEEIRQALTEVRDTIREEINEAARPKEKVICPYCGASTIPDANGCCEYCGAALTGR